MLLAVDIGNTSTKFGVFDGEQLMSRFDVPTHSEDLVADIDGRLESNFDSAIVCCVVPEAGERLERLLTHGYQVKPLFVTTSVDLGITIKHEPLETLGADRFVNAFAASKNYGVPAIVCSFGTATTIDMVNSERELVGGVIAPGMPLMAKALNEHTARLPLVEMGETRDTLGTTTPDAIRSGIYFSLIGLVESVVDRLRDETQAQVIATGGFAETVAAGTNRLDIVDADLTLKGLCSISARITAKKK